MQKITVERIIGKSRITSYPKEFRIGDHIKITFEKKELVKEHE